MIHLKSPSSIAIVLCALLMTISCEQNSNLPKPTDPNATSQNGMVANYTFDGTEGSPITLDVATGWIANYTNQNQGKFSAHFFGRKTLERMLNMNGSLGIRFYYSLDDSKNSFVLATATDRSGQDFSTSYKMKARVSSIALKDISLSTTALFSGVETDSVATDVSKHWRANYNNSNPKGIQAHFFGFEIIKQILAETGCVGIRCYYALNNAGVQQLLLVGVTSNGQSILPLTLLGGRTADDGTVADASAPCPSYCTGTL
jgi:hypothetical protein